MRAQLHLCVACGVADRICQVVALNLGGSGSEASQKRALGHYVDHVVQQQEQQRQVSSYDNTMVVHLHVLVLALTIKQ